MTLGPVEGLILEEAVWPLARRPAPAGEKQAQREDLMVSELIDRYLEDGPASRPDKKGVELDFRRQQPPPSYGPAARPASSSDSDEERRRETPSGRDRRED